MHTIWTYSLRLFLVCFRYHLMQQSKKRYAVIATYWMLHLLCCFAVLVTVRVRPIVTAIIMPWFLFCIFLIFVVHVLVVKRMVSKQCMLHVLKFHNRRVMVGECTPKEKRIINTSLWSIFPFIACNLPFAIATLCSFNSLYLASAVLLDVGIINPIIWFVFAYSQRDRAVAPKAPRAPSEHDVPAERDEKMSSVKSLPMGNACSRGTTMG